MKPYLLIACFVMMLAYNASAQTDSSITNTHSITSKKNPANKPPPRASFAPGLVTISLKDINSHLGEYIQVSDIVYGYRVLDTLEVMAFGAAYPNQALTVVLQGKAFEALKASNVIGKTIVVTGIITVNKENKDPQMIVSDLHLIRVY